MISKLEWLLRNRKNDSCVVSNMVSPRKNVELSLNKCSDKTKLRASAYDGMIR